ncbi:transposition regulatory protein tnpA, partial [Staphylococcus aureus A5937]
MYTYTIKFRNEIIMKIVEVKSKNGINFMILDGNNEPIVDAVRYLKYLDSVKKSLNTKKTYAYALKKFFVYLENKKICYKEVSFDNFVDFIRWMKKPFENENVLSYHRKEISISPKTINLTMTVVSNFYDYLYRSKKLDVNFYDFIHMESKYSKKYKSFMHHVNKDYRTLKNILKVKEPKKKIEVLTNAEVKKLLGETNNIRDKFLIQLLYETGLRIGEVLSLRIDDIKFDFRKGHQIVLKNRLNDNGTYLKTGERKIFISQSLIDLYDDYVYEIIDELSICSDYLFVKI